MSTIKKEAAKYFNESVTYHNNVSIVDYASNKSIPTGQRAIMKFVYFYSSPENANKAPEDRIIIQNPELLRQLGYNIPQESYKSAEFEKNVSAVQSMLERYELDGFWKRQFYSRDGEWIDLYLEDENGKKVYNPATHGLTKRRIILNEQKIKLLLSTLPSDAADNKIEKGSREKRMLLSRPITLVDYLLANVRKTTAKDAVDRVNAKKRIINKYMQDQAKKLGNFSLVKNTTELDKELKADAIKEALDYITLDASKLIGKFNDELAN